MRVAVGVLGLAWLGVLAAYAYSALTVQPSIASVIAAVGAVAIAGAAFLYAWREPGR